MTHPHDALTKAHNPINDLGFGAETQPEAAPVDAVAEDTGLRPDVKFETRLEALQRENRERAGIYEAQIVAAEAAGTLWSVQAAMYPSRVFCCLYHGRNDDIEPFASQHTDAPAIFGPVALVGMDHRTAMFEAMKLFTVDEITIRTVR